MLMPRVVQFEDWYTPCFGFGPCSQVTRLNISSPRGQGVAYTKYGEMERPLLIPNLGAWQVINCTWEGLAGKDEQFAVCRAFPIQAEFVVTNTEDSVPITLSGPCIPLENRPLIVLNHA